MRLYALLVFDHSVKLLHAKYNLDGIFFIYHWKIKEVVEKFAKRALLNLDSAKIYKVQSVVESKDIVQNLGDNISAYATESIVIIVSQDYPQNTVYQLIKTIQNIGILDNHTSNDTLISELFNKYQNPREVDKLHLISGEIDQTKLILLETVEKLLERGDKISELTEKTEKLTMETMAFKKEAQKLNRCCILF